jgi:hypothetical protein
MSWVIVNFEVFVAFMFGFVPTVHYEKLCPRQLNYLTTRAPKQLIYNCITIVPWKYNKLINKMSHQKIRSYIVVANCIFIQCNVRISFSQPYLTLLTSCILVTCNNYVTIRIIIITNKWILCNKCTTLSNTYNHAMWLHFHHLIYMTFQLVYN